ncbi:PucR family transcriptional regulator ligand-binding domain-containing protein [Paenibacillus chondroitinus]|uniref:PucR family transcriptional regulator ligand-binding domain-containing protein n=1 Tax=Paenibacillus chondroitinus TaxID=59842 RepID=A0ABU6DN88_9BACL|nr:MULTISPECIES: PucR family transcriptional regulator [Paenibacillus]MCY9662089.1 PucR family transcriptional regulator ligand-binding domain-containing protein [Paenibacillus anseongense]MEB4798306.1 PucR family transcriptional regulator ligand-binding domain-containing protein [Paenibacillus chondroitinus]
MSEQRVGHGLICRDLLGMPHLAGSKVLAGHPGLDTAVIRVNVMEVPDVIDWVMPGEFLISTGYPFRDNPSAFAELIPQLVEKGVAALGIKTKRFLDEIPTRVLDVAEQYQFPIIELPPGTVFSEVVREVMERVLVHEAAQLALLQRRFQRFSELLLEGKGLEDLLGHVEEELTNPILLLSSVGKLRVSPSTERLTQEMGLKKQLTLEQLQKNSKLGIQHLVIGDREIKMTVTKIKEQYGIESFLLLLEWHQELTPIDTLTLERLGVLIHLEMMNMNARREVEAKYIDQFLQDWLIGRIGTRRDLDLRAEACGCPIDHNGYFRVVLVRWLAAVPDAVQLKRIVQQLRQQESLHSRDFLYVILGDHLVVLFNSEASLQEKELRRRLKASLQGINSQHSSPFTFSFCLGKIVNSAEDVNESYLQASNICTISYICGMEQEMITYEDLGIYKILYLLPQGRELAKFREEWIAPLEAHDWKHQSSLIYTLFIYFDQNENVRKTAQKLYTHHNTVIYRLERVKELLNVDLQHADDRLQLQIALKLYAMEMRRLENGNEPLRGGL